MSGGGEVMQNGTTKPPIDILLAVYNGGRYLRPFLDSLHAQSFSDFRLVVSNNASCDDTELILEAYREKFSDRLCVLPQPERLLPPLANFARVTEAGEAPYIMYADGDDVWHSDKVKKTFQVMSAAARQFGPGEPLLVHSDLRVVDQNLQCVHSSFWRYQFVDPHRNALRHLLLQNCVTGCTAMLNRPLFDLGRPIPPEACVHDHWFALVASAFGQIVPIHESLIDYRQHGDNVTGARRFGAAYVMNRAIRLYAQDGARRAIAEDLRQAKAFRTRFKTRLNPEQKRILENFIAIGSQGALSRRWNLVHNRFWKAGLARNLGLLLAV